MKVRYSIEAFALAMVLFTTGLETALIAAAVIVFGTILGDLLADKAGKTAAAVIAAVVTCAVLIAALLYTGLVSGTGICVEYVSAVLAAVLVGKHVYDGVEEAGTGEILKQNYVALAVMAVVAVIREILGSGAVFGYEIGSFAVISSAYLKNSMGLVFAGLALAAVNGILKKEAAGDSLYVAVAVVLTTVAAAALKGSGVDATAVIKSVISSAIAVVLLVGIRRKMIFSTPGKSFAGLPVEIISLGFLTMMLSVIA